MQAELRCQKGSASIVYGHITSFNCLRSEAESAVASNAAILPGLCILYIRSKKVGELVKLIK